MIKDKPLIQLFQTPLGYYLFDANRNTIIKTEKQIFEFLQKELKGGAAVEAKNGEEETLQAVEKLRECGFLSSNRVLEIKHPADETLEYYLDRRLEMITLQVTQQCNLRCSYCVYTNPGTDLQRGHSNKRMDYATAVKGIDFLLKHSIDSRQISIGFYGGEPLLEFDLLKKCIEYAEERAEGKELSFSITSNGTLMNKEIIEYLIKHGVNLTISLDGPKEIHDSNRRFAADGGGTFDAIMKNIEMVRQEYPDFYDSIFYSMVIDPENDFNCTSQFYIDNKSISESNLIPAIADDRYTREKYYITDDFYTKFRYEIFKYYLHKLGRISKENVTGIVAGEYVALKRIHEKLMPIPKLPDSAHHGGPCVAGARRLFMDTEGNFYPCERVSETSSIMRIGHVDSGFDVDKARKILNVGKITENSCKNCWALFFCTMCVSYADNVNDMSAALKKAGCNAVQAGVEDSFKDYTVLRELGYDFEAALMFK